MISKPGKLLQLLGETSTPPQVLVVQILAAKILLGIPRRFDQLVLAPASLPLQLLDDELGPDLLVEHQEGSLPAAAVLHHLARQHRNLLPLLECELGREDEVLDAVAGGIAPD